MFFTLSALIFSGLGAVSALPLLEVSGFSWAENLAFDGRGSLFVSDVATGELSRIYLCGKKIYRYHSSYVLLFIGQLDL